MIISEKHSNSSKINKTYPGAWQISSKVNYEKWKTSKKIAAAKKLTAARQKNREMQKTLTVNHGIKRIRSI